MNLTREILKQQASLEAKNVHNNNGNTYHYSSTYGDNYHKSANLDWTEANKNHACPICQKHDWCYLGFDGISLEMAICGRAPISVDSDWVAFGTSNDGRTKYRKHNPEFRTEKTYTPPQTREWVYTDINGNAVAKQIRIDREGQDKQIYRNYFVNGKWVKKLPNSVDQKEFKAQIAPLYWNEVDNAIAKGEPVFICEGETPTDAVRSLGLTATTFIGGKWADHLAEYFTGGKVVLCPDSDSTGIKLMDTVAIAIAKIVESIQWLYAYPHWNALWDNALKQSGNGLDLKDYLQDYPSMDADKLMEQIENARRRFEKQFSSTKTDSSSSDGKLKKQDKPRCGEIASKLYDKYRDHLAWDTSIQQWRRYAATQNGVWEKEVSEFVRQVLYAEIEAMETIESEDITPSLVKAVEELLQWKLAVRKWDVEDRNLLPVKNGVLNLQTKELMEHSPNFRLTWCLPTHYDPTATCEPIKNWLLEMCGDDPRLMALMQVYLYGILTGRTDWQKYLELVGAGGTGKSTYIRLAIALVGGNNVHTTTLKKLEGSRFETACIKDKRLVVITDSERYSGSVSILKALTGQDSIPYEQKMKQSTGGFIPRAMVLVAANEMIQSGDYTSGLERRRISIPFNNKIPATQQRNLIELGEDNEIHGEFVKYIPGLLNWVLSVDPEKATAMVKDYVNAVPSLNRMKAESLVETNPIADWLDNAIVHRPDHRTQIGVAKRDKSPDTATQYYNVDQWLYANYCEYCSNTQSKPVGLRRFVSLLSDLCSNQLELDGVKRERDRNGRYFVGLKIRSDGDSDPPLIIGQPVTGVTDSVTDSVTTKTPMSAKCDECDGSNQIQPDNSQKYEERSVTQTLPNKKQICEDEPSQPANSALATDSATTESSQYPSQPAPVPTTSTIANSFNIGDEIFCDPEKSYGRIIGFDPKSDKFQIEFSNRIRWHFRSALIPHIA